MITLSLDIKIVPCGDNADLYINGRNYPLATATLQSTDDLRNYLCNEPAYVVEAVISLLQEAVL